MSDLIEADKHKRLRDDMQRLYKSLERIAVAHGITTPIILIAMAENDEENYAEILARFVEKKMAVAVSEVQS